jgi:hypothetical protein
MKKKNQNGIQYLNEEVVTSVQVHWVDFSYLFPIFYSEYFWNIIPYHRDQQ